MYWALGLAEIECAGSGDLRVRVGSTRLADADLVAATRSERLVWGTYRENDHLVLFGTEDNVDNLAKFVAFESNHLAHRRRQRRPV
jgi:hypothetical protein